MLRFVLVVLVGLSGILGFFDSTVEASSPVASPPADCTGVAEYVAELKEWYQRFGELFDAMGASFEGLTSMTPDQMAELSQGFRKAADDLETIDSPAIASAYHIRLVKEVRIFANAINDMPTLGIFGAIAVYFGSDTPSAGELTADQWEAKLAGQCSDFADYLEWRLGPEASPAAG